MDQLLRVGARKLADEVQARWEVPADGATILQQIEPASRSAACGMPTDRIGVTWIIDVAPGAA